MTRLRICHTADWHLGQVLHRNSREAEHQAFLDWLLNLLEERAVDVLIIAGDVFDRAVPPASAESAYYRFLTDLRRRVPKVDVVVVSGNHDSALRLEAPGPMLRELGVHVTGSLRGSRDDAGVFRAEAPVVPIVRDGVVLARILAIPFLRPVDLLRERPDLHRRTNAAHELYQRAASELERTRSDGEVLIATGHGTVRGAILSPESERPLLGGEASDFPADAFPPCLDYVALGHLHFAQQVGERAHVRYSGSPIPLSFAELEHPHQVVLATFEGGALSDIEPVRVPRHTELKRVPAEGSLPLVEVERLLREVVAERSGGPSWIEARVVLDAADLALRVRLERALEGGHAKLVHVRAERPPVQHRAHELHSLAAATPQIAQVWGGLLDPMRVVEARYKEQATEGTSPDLDPETRALMASLIQEIEADQGADGPAPPSEIG